MDAIRRILCATERGAEGGLAVRQAEEIAKVHGAELAFFAVAPGDSVTGILRRAESFRADLVVLQGAEPDAPEERLVDAVVRHAPCPVLVARTSPATGSIVVATDLVDPALPAVATAVDEARRRHGHVLLVHNVDTRLGSFGWGILTTLIRFGSSDLIAGVEEAARHRMAAALRAFGAEGETVLAHGAPAAAVLKLAVTLPAELVVIATPGETSLRTLLFGSVVETVVHWAPCSVLVVPVRPASESLRTFAPHAERTLEGETRSADGSLVEEPAHERDAVRDPSRR